MHRKFTRTALVAIALAGAVITSGMPAQAAQHRPAVTPGDELLISYYSTPQHTQLIGQYGGCPFIKWGTQTGYSVLSEVPCP
jgi:hypothetical protein